MEIKTFDTILTEICDSFDSLISPKKMSRSNTNIIYLIFKAIAKGLEIINNVCVVLSNKFDPYSCSEEDLESVARMVGTSRIQASASGLRIICTNNGEVARTLRAGTYVYALDDDTKFSFDVLSDTQITSGSYVKYLAMSETVGKFPVTEQQTIEVTSNQEINSDLVFSCADNSKLLGRSEETNLEFRKRILTDTKRQDTFSELELLIKNLPYIFDCTVLFNPTVATESYDGIAIPPFTLAIFFSGEIKNEIAEVIASKIICPTVETEGSVVVSFISDTFASGRFDFNIIPFSNLEYDVELIYKLDDTILNDYDTKSKIRTALFNTFVNEIHKDYVKEDEYYNAVDAMNITGFELLGVNLKLDGANTNFITVPKSKIAELTDVIFTRIQ